MAPACALYAPLIRYVLAAFALALAVPAAGSPAVAASGLLANGGFEQGTDAWSANAGQIDVVQSPVHDGSRSGRFTGSGQPTTQYVYQWINVQPDEEYEASGWVAAMGGGVSRVFLRVSWYDSTGQLLINTDSAWLPLFDGSFYPLTTGVGVSLSAARSARIAAVVQADSAFTVHLDGFEFSGPPAIPSTPPPAPTPTPYVPPASSPTPKPPTATARPTPRPAATRTPAQSPGVAPGTDETPEAVEPDVFPHLVNGGFEELRSGETPVGWRKQGGKISSAGDYRTDGLRSLALSSATGSTKWAYQTVAVIGGTHYQAAVDTRAGEGAESAFLRISWYASGDGSGPAISSVDSISQVAAGADFQRIMTEASLAPPGAASAKIRLMLRPASEQPAIAYFDSAAFAQAQPGDQVLSLAAGRGRRSEPGAGVSEGAPESTEDITQADRASVVLANVKPPETSNATDSSAAGSDQNYWAVALALGIAAAAVSIAGVHEFWQRRRSRDGALGDD